MNTRHLRSLAGVLTLVLAVAGVARLRAAGPADAIPLPTMGGKQFWADELFFHQWRIQRNVLTGHYRLLDGKTSATPRARTTSAWPPWKDQAGAATAAHAGQGRRRAARPGAPTAAMDASPVSARAGRLHGLQRQLSQHAATTWPSNAQSLAPHHRPPRRHRGDQLRRPQHGQHRDSPLSGRPDRRGQPARPAGRGRIKRLRHAGPAQPRLAAGRGVGRQQGLSGRDRRDRPAIGPRLAASWKGDWPRPLSSSASSPAAAATSTATTRFCPATTTASISVETTRLAGARDFRRRARPPLVHHGQRQGPGVHVAVLAARLFRLRTGEAR